MKTEGLTWAEAIKAYGNGERVRDAKGTEFWLQGETALKQYLDRTNISPDVTYLGIDQHYGPFSIVKPEPKTLTFEEAYEEWASGKSVKVDTSALDEGSSITLRQGRLPSETISLLVAAELKGWLITVAE
jgi:hypothetical protein